MQGQRTERKSLGYSYTAHAHVYEVVCAYQNCKRGDGNTRKKFEAKRWDASFCGDACRKAHHRDKKRALRQVQVAAIEVRQMTKDFPQSQDIKDALLLLHTIVENAIRELDPKWIQQTLFSSPAPSTSTTAAPATKAPRKPRAARQQQPPAAPEA